MPADVLALRRNLLPASPLTNYISCTSCFAMQQMLCALQSIITVVTGWYAMNLNNMHPQSFPWFYSVGVALRCVPVTSIMLLW
jgi:hypothetical protein